MSNKQIWLSFLIMSFVTILIRSLPFLAFRKNNTPKWVENFSNTLPYAVMGMLVVYCLKGISFTQASSFVPELISVGVVVGSYVWKKNTLLSIIVGTVLYMVLVQFVFI